MDVLKAIHANVSPFVVDYGEGETSSLDVKCGESSCDATGEENVVDSDDEALMNRRHRQFGSKLAAFSYEPQSLLTQPLQFQHTSSLSRPVLSKPNGTLHTMKPPSIHPPKQQQVQEEEEETPLSPEEPLYRIEDLPELPDSLAPILRSFINCPICLQPFPVLSLEEPVTKKAVAKKTKKSKKKKVKKAQTGADRLSHLQICALHNATSSEMVMSLITKERIRLDRNQRQDYNEEVNKQGMWKTLTGDEPPSSQVQRDSVKRHRKRTFTAKDKASPATSAKAKAKGGKAKAAISTVSFKAGKRGGLSRASTTILAPRLTRSEVKRKCVELFGPPKEAEQSRLTDIWSLYDHHDENTSRSRAARQRSILLGLGVGACSQVLEEQETNGALARLGMGSTLGYTIAQRYKSSN